MVARGVFKEALVLAGGVGSRLSSITMGEPKYLLTIKGLPLTLYPVLVLWMTGVERFVIVVAEKFSSVIRRRFSGLLREVGAEVVYVENPRPDLENGYSLLLGAKEVAGEEFIVTVGDHLYTTKLVSSVASHRFREAGVVVGGDPEPKYVDVSEATKILADEGHRLTRIGKHLDSYTHVDVGVFTFKKSVFNNILFGTARGAGLTLSDLLLELVRSGVDVRVAELRDAVWYDVDTPEDVRGLLEGGGRRVLEAVWSEVSSYLGRGES